ncbi:MAG: toxin-antitoxin system HicB family antitoxin [Proteobacteria bacterium]|nr:toxin-antitoxin system HicB family antitoxin [Pseudomonadota bacterium]
MSEKKKPRSISLRLPVDLHARALEEANEQGASLSEYLRYCIASKVAEHRITRTHARHAVDAARDARKDLANVLAQVPAARPDPWDQISSVAEAPAEYVDLLDRFIKAGGKYPKPS